MKHISSKRFTMGFTLVELAVALMVIGLLIGGVLKGRELIDNAKITALVRDIKSYDAAALTFFDRYGALPGDIKNTSLIPNCTSAACNIGGNQNDQVLANTSLSPMDIERFNFFPHLTKAGFIKGPEGGTVAQINAPWAHYDVLLPRIPFDIETPYISVSYQGPGAIWPPNIATGHKYMIWFSGELGQQALVTKIMMQIDQKLDDGKPYQGKVMLHQSGNDCPVTGANGDGNEISTDADYDATALSEETNPYSGILCEMSIHAAF